MKHPRRLKFWMKELLTSKSLLPDNYWYVKNLPGCLVVIHKNTKEVKEVLYE